VQRVLQDKGFHSVKVWGRGVDSSLFSPAKRSASLRLELGAGPDDVVLLTVARLAPEKNLHTLLAAFRLLRDRCGSARLWVVGDGPARRSLEDQAGEGVVFTGFRHGEDLAAAYASADLFVFASLTETFGNVLQEAMASALPVVAFRAPGPAETVQHGQTGLLVDGQQADALAGAAERLVQDVALRRRLGDQARDGMLGRSWAACTASVRDAYAGVAATLAARRPPGEPRVVPGGSP